MNGHCDSENCSPYGRSFFSREEKIQMLKEYKDYLEKEAKGVSEKIKDLEKAA
jgi:uncharacterized protein (DUF2164 family)